MRSLVVLGATAALAVSAAPASAAPACTEDAALGAIEDTPAFVTAIEASGEPLEGFDIDRLMCDDLAGSKKREMAVFLTCCNSEVSPTPFIVFRARRGEWRAAYQNTTFLVSSAKLAKRKIQLRHPVYKRTDMPCCPSSVQRYELQYRKKQFRLTRP